jgi:hypothetical protein
MSVYTVHEPPRAADALRNAERLSFVRDGFYVWGFLLAPLWMLWHRMWLVLVGYLVTVAALDAATMALGGSTAAVAFVGLLVALLVGLEASTLRRLTLNFRGWKNVGVVSGDDLEDAERRFFEAWLSAPASPPPLPAAAGSAPPALPRRSPEVIGLFPEPGGPR